MLILTISFIKNFLSLFYCRVLVNSTHGSIENCADYKTSDESDLLRDGILTNLQKTASLGYGSLFYNVSKLLNDFIFFVWNKFSDMQGWCECFEDISLKYSFTKFSYFGFVGRQIRIMFGLELFF